MAQRPCNCAVLGLRPKSSLCSCQQLLCTRAGQCTEHVYVAKSTFFEGGCVTFAEYFTGKGASPTNHCCCQKTGVIAISCGIKISAVHHLVLSQYTHMTDGQNCDSNTVCRITGSCTVKIVLSYTTTCCTGSDMHI